MMRRSAKWVAVLLAALLLGSGGWLPGGPSSAAAAGTVWHVRDGGAGSRTGESWGNAFATLQAALEAATIGDQIWLAAGTYYPTKDHILNTSPGDPSTLTFMLKNDVAIYGGFPATGDPTMDDRDWTRNATILSGDLDKSGDLTPADAYHVVYLHSNSLFGAVDETAVLDGVTITGSNAREGNRTLPTQTWRGGGMLSYQSSPTLRHVTFTGNYAHQGGGMAVEDGQPTLFNVTFANNTAANGDGGGLAIVGAASRVVMTRVDFKDNAAGFTGGGLYVDKAEVTLEYVTVEDNKTTRNVGRGGGIRLRDSTASLEEVIISGNTADHGGGMYIEGGTVTLSYVEFSANSVNFRDASGGGLYSEASTVTLEEVEFDNNKAVDPDPLRHSTRGGGMFTSRSTVTMAFVDFYDNAADYGGGLYTSEAQATMDNVYMSGNDAFQGGAMMNRALDSPGHGLTMQYSHFVNNTADRTGGAIYNEASSPVTLTNVLIYSNKAGLYGGGITNDQSDITLENVLLSGNAATEASDLLQTNGGGMHNTDSHPTLTNVTMAGNFAKDGGGAMHNDQSHPLIRNTIIWGNSGTISNDGSIPVISYSLVEGSGGSAAWDATLGTDGGHNLDADPDFRDLKAPSDAPTMGGDYRLNADSPAINVGHNAFITTITDLYYNDRVANGRVDLGALEADSGPAEVTATKLLADIVVPRGTERTGLPLPATVGALLSGGRTIAVGVTWDNGAPAYDKNTLGEYVFTGQLALPENVNNTADVIASQKVVVRRVSEPPPPLASEETEETTTPPTDRPFTDIAGHWAESEISTAAAAGLLAGYPDGTFRPDDNVTRLQFTVVLVRALGLIGSGRPIPFGDKDDIPDWAEADMALAVEHGVVRGYDDGTFRPNASVNRAELAALVARALNLDLTPHATPFADDADIPDWAREYVAAVELAGLMQGKGGNRFVPLATATRAETAVLLLRVWSSVR